MALPSVLFVFSLLFQGTFADKKVSVQEVVFDSAVLDIQWMGTDFKTVVLQTDKGRLYRSTTGGDAWNDITDQLMSEAENAASLKEKYAQGPFQVDRLQKSPADPNVIMVQGTGKRHFISVNGGTSWRRVRQTSTIHTWMFHKTRPKWAMLSTWTEGCEAGKAAKAKNDPCNHMLYMTKDLGRTFTLVASYVVQFSWGDAAHNQEDRIYFTHFRQKKGDQPKLSMWSRLVDFAYTDDFGGKMTRLVYRGNKFLISSKFVFVAKLKNTESQTVSLMSSSDGGASFKQAVLPEELDERSYTILDTSEGNVMLHVNHGAGALAGSGNVYVSDKDGVRFSLSLPNNVRSSRGDCEFDRILSLEGVYMANFKDIQRAGDAEISWNDRADSNEDAEALEEEATAGTAVDKKHSVHGKAKAESVTRTVISFDKGGAWGFLKAPKVDSLGKTVDCPDQRCSLHLHGITNFENYAPFYSIEQAAGLIMGTGNVGPYLRFEPDQINTYLSRDGGLTWMEAHKGAFIYEFGDHGGLVLMANDIQKTKQVVFSWNEGLSWYDFEFGEGALDVDNIVTEPNATTTTFLLYGTRGNSGVLYHMDFQALGQPMCKGVWAADSVSSDYETWMPSDGRSTEACILGRQITYTRRKAASECFNGEKFERPVTRKNCACTEEDFDCELGFARKIGSVDCRLVDETLVAAPETCTSSDFYYIDAYRRVVGDTCEGGWQPQKIAVPCPANSKMSRGAMSTLSTFALIAVAMGAIAFLSKTERFKGVFSNYGFESFNNVKYAGIGANMPELAFESVGTRYDDLFNEGEQNEFDDAPELMTYTGGGPQGGSARNSNEARTISGGIHTAAAAVPKLSGPPGGSSNSGPANDDSMDLL